MWIIINQFISLLCQLLWVFVSLYVDTVNAQNKTKDFSKFLYRQLRYLFITLFNSLSLTMALLQIYSYLMWLWCRIDDLYIAVLLGVSEIGKKKNRKFYVDNFITWFVVFLVCFFCFFFLKKKETISFRAVSQTI